MNILEIIDKDKVGINRQKNKNYGYNMGKSRML